jgi:predicted NBD/HSP70 family sugar kinase
MIIIQKSGEKQIRLTADEKLLIDQLLFQPESTRMSLSQALDVSPAWITKIIKPLMARNLLEESGDAEKSGGRRAKLLCLSPEVGSILGLDLGNDSLKLGLSDLNARDLRFSSISLNGQHLSIKQDQFFQETIQDFLKSSGKLANEIRAVSLSLSDPVGISETGMSRFLTGENPILEVIKRQFPDALILADRDVNLMSLGELSFGQGKDAPNFIFLKLGNTISAGIVAKGRLYNGASGSAGDIGHIIVDDDGPACICGQQGCLVAITGGQAIANQAMRLAASGQSPILSSRFISAGKNLSAIDVGEAASQGDLAAIKLIDQCGEHIGQVLSVLVRFFNPNLVFVGGGVSRIGHRLINTIRQVVLREASPAATRDLQITYSKLGDQAGVLGAIKLAQSELFVERSE